MGQTPIYAFPFPELTDPADVPTDMGELATAVEGTLSGPFDSRLDALEAGVGSMARLADVLLAADAANIDFQNIPQTYAHLLLAGAVRTTAAVLLDSLFMRINGDAGASYHTHGVLGSNNTVSAFSLVAGQSLSIAGMPGASAPAGIQGKFMLWMPGYTRANGAGWVSVAWALTGGTAAGFNNMLRGGHWAGSTAVNRLTVLSTAGQLASGSRVTLYGLRGT